MSNRTNCCSGSKEVILRILVGHRAAFGYQSDLLTWPSPRHSRSSTPRAQAALRLQAAGGLVGACHSAAAPFSGLEVKAPRNSGSSVRLGAAGSVVRPPQISRTPGGHHLFALRLVRTTPR